MPVPFRQVGCFGGALSVSLVVSLLCAKLTGTRFISFFEQGEEQMRREKLVVPPWDRRVLMALLPKGGLTQLRFIREENPAVKSKPKLFNWEWAATCGIFSICRRVRCPFGVWCCTLAEQGCQGPCGRARLMVLSPHIQYMKRLFPLGRGHTQCHNHSWEKATPQHKHQTPRGAGQSVAMPLATTMQAMYCLGHQVLISVAKSC